MLKQTMPLRFLPTSSQLTLTKLNMLDFQYTQNCTFFLKSPRMIMLLFKPLINLKEKDQNSQLSSRLTSKLRIPPPMNSLQSSTPCSKGPSGNTSQSKIWYHTSLRDTKSQLHSNINPSSPRTLPHSKILSTLSRMS